MENENAWVVREKEREEEGEDREKKKATEDGKCRMLVGKREQGKRNVGMRQNERASSVVRRSAGNF